MSCVTKMIAVPDWEVVAANMLKAELKREGVTYAQLADLVDEKEVNIRDKLSRGKFFSVVLAALPEIYRLA